MVDAHVPEIMAGIDQRLAAGVAWPTVTGGHAAAVAVVGLMQKTFKAITPREIIDTFVPLQDEKPSARARDLWEKLGDRTIDVMADGCFALAQIWDSAWKEGNGDANITTFDQIDEATLEGLYRSSAFLTSYKLDTIGPVLKGSAVLADDTPTAPRRGRRVRASAK
jgi:hypothetical protein